MRDLFVVVPCYNEARRLPEERFLQFARRRPEVRFLMVDDGSTDATPEVLGRMCDRLPAQFEWLQLSENRGKAEAVRQGMLAAMRSPCRYAAFLDADLAAPLDELPLLRSVLDNRPEVQVVLAIRVAMMGRTVRRRRLRGWLGRCSAFAVSAALGMPFHDTQCGMKMFRCGPATQPLFDEPFCSRWLFDVECLARFLAARGRSVTRREVYEMPIHRWDEIAGSSVKSGDFLRAFRDLLKIHRRYVWNADLDRPAPEPATVSVPFPVTGDGGAPARRRAA